MANNAQVIGVDTVIANLEAFSVKTLAKAEVAMKKIAADNESSAKETAPWTDRTGNARASITGSTGREGTWLLAALAIGVFYGLYLEVSNGSKYAVVWPTMNARRKQMLETLIGIVEV